MKVRRRPVSGRPTARRLTQDVVLLGLIWGASVVLQRAAVAEIDPLHLIVFRMTAGVLFFVPFLPRVRRALANRPRLMLDLAIIGSLNPAAAGVLSGFALQFASSGVVAVLISLAPLLTALLARLVLREEALGPPQLGGLAVAFVGVGLLIATRSTGLGAGLDGDLRGHFFALGIAAIMATATVYARKRLIGTDPLAAAAGQIATGLAPAAVVALLMAPPLDLGAVSILAWLAVIGSGVVGLGASFILFLSMIERHGPTAALLALYVMPLAATLLGAIFLNETVTPPMLAGGGLVLAGVLLFSRR